MTAPGTLANRTKGTPTGATAALVPTCVLMVAMGACKDPTEEAKTHVKKIYDGARVYWMLARDSGQSPQFPEPSTGWTADPNCCAAGGDREECKADPSLWDKQPWTALDFRMDESHRYAYKYVVNVGEPGAMDGSHNFTALARGDLDCDGVYATFKMGGEINIQAPDSEP